MRRFDLRAVFQITLLVATGVAVVASQGPADVWTTTDAVDGPTLTLTSADPDRTLRVVLTTFPSDVPLGEPLSATVEVVTTSFWEPPEGDPAPERPEIRVGLAPEGLVPEGAETEATVLSERETTRLTVSTLGLDGCTDGDACTEVFDLSVARSGAPTEGTVTVEFTARAVILGAEGQAPPPGFGATLALE